MYFHDDDLDHIHGKTRGRCRCCGKNLTRKNHGIVGAYGAWQVDHSIPLARNGSNNMRNLFPMCVDCNQAKGTMTWSEFRGRCSKPID